MYIFFHRADATRTGNPTPAVRTRSKGKRRRRMDPVALQIAKAESKSGVPMYKTSKTRIVASNIIKLDDDCLRFAF